MTTATVTTAFVPTSPADRSRPAAPPAEAAASTPARAAGVLAVLRTDPPAATQPTPNPLASFAAAVLTLGCLPAVLWVLRFPDVVALDRGRFDRLAAWASGRLREPEARALRRAVGRVRPRQWLTGISLAAAVAAMVCAAVWISEFSGRGYGGVGSKLLNGASAFLGGGSVPGDAALRTTAFAAWVGGLTVAYAGHLLQVHLHARAVRRFLDEFNRTVAVEEGFGPVLLEPIGFGFSPLWVSAAVALLFVNAWWAVPFAAAGATDRRYRRKASVKMRRDLAARVRDVIFDSPELSRPATAVPFDAVRCATPGCGGALGPAAKFCPRCGARRGRSVDRKA